MNRHKPRKRFGQNFLKDQQVISRIIKAINPKPGQTVVEIGPGFGALTEPLLFLTKKLYAIELDRDIIPHLKARCEEVGELIIYEADITRFDFSVDLKESRCEKKSLRFVGNLPYNISTQLIFHLLKQKDLIQDMHFMLQKEVVERMVAQPGSKTYGRLSVMVQYYFRAHLLFTIPPTAFDPPPKVNSALVRLEPYDTLPHIAKDESLFAVIVREAFNHRRKTIHNALKDTVDPKVLNNALNKANIDPKWRPEQLSVVEFVALANFSEYI